MSPKNASLATGLTVLGLASGLATMIAADRPAPVTPPGPAAPTDAPPSVLLLTTGQIVQGTITETDDGYEVRTKIGPLPVRRRQVEGTFASLAEVYAYKLQRLPAGDTDERLKLARWCLEQKLTEEAQDQLEAVLASSPGHGPAKAMLFQINASARAATTADPAVMRTGAERADPPGTLSLAGLRDAAKASPRGAALPVIFDLPPALAVKRYQEFAVFVHPALQQRCAECHHETSNLSFQLMRARAKRDLENELLVRANLDAVLRLVDPKDPARSPLLAAAVMPHKPTGRPILTGPNDPTYGRIYTWLNGIKAQQAATAAAPQDTPAAPAPADGVVPARFNGSSQPPGRPGGFAADRRGTTAPTAPTAPSAVGPTFPVPPRMAPLPAPEDIGAPNTVRTPNGETIALDPTPAGQILPGSTVGLPSQPPPPSAFRPPALPPSQAAATPEGGPSAAPAGAAKKTINVPGVGEVEVADLDEPSAEAKAKKKPKIKADALQKFMSGGRR